MDKGVKGWHNVQLLKWSREYGLRLSWSILWGFPGEKDEWYAEMVEWMLVWLGDPLMFAGWVALRRAVLSANQVNPGRPIQP